MHVKELRGVSYAVSLIALAGVSSAAAQSNYGALRGIVTDGQGAVVSAAVVTLTSESTKIARTTNSNSDGEYVFNAVAPGRYNRNCDRNGLHDGRPKGAGRGLRRHHPARPQASRRGKQVTVST